MDNNNDKKLKYLYNDKNYLIDPINNNINHTNINNNINITNYYPSPSQNYCNKQTFTFIDQNGIIQNAISYPIKANAHKTKKIKESSHTPNNNEKKNHKCQSPYMKKILPSSKRDKSEDNNRISNICKNSSSQKYLKSNNKNSLSKNSYKQTHLSIRKQEKQNTNNKNIKNNPYLDLSTDEINNKFKRIINYNQNYPNANNTEIKEIKSNNFKNHTKPLLKKDNIKSRISYESNGYESQFNNLQKQKRTKRAHGAASGIAQSR